MGLATVIIKAGESLPRPLYAGSPINDNLGGMSENSTKCAIDSGKYWLNRLYFCSEPIYVCVAITSI